MLGLSLAIIVVLGGGPTILKIVRAARGRNGARGEAIPLPLPQLGFNMEPGVVKYRLEQLEKAVLDPDTGLVVEVHALKETCAQIQGGVEDLKKSQPIHIQQVVDAVRGIRAAAEGAARKAVEEELTKRGLP